MWGGPEIKDSYVNKRAVCLSFLLSFSGVGIFTTQVVINPGEKFPKRLRNLGVLITLIFPFEKLPTNKIERHCVRSALQRGVAKNKSDAIGSKL